MATVIDELIVTLGLDGAKFRGDADRTQSTINQVGRNAVQSGKSLEDSLRRTQTATDRRMKQTAEVGRTSSQQFSKFRVEVAALFTTLATGFGLTQFVKNLANTEAATGRLAKNIGMSTQELNAWQEAAIRNGGSAEATGASFQGLTQQFQQFALTGNSAVIPYFRALGVSLSDAEGEMRPMRDIMLDLADKFQNMSPQRANAFGSSIGLDQGTITLLRQGRVAVQQYLSEAERLGVVNEQQAQNAIAFKQKLADLEQAFNTLGRVVLDAAMPQITAFVKALTDWVSSPANQKFISDEVINGVKEFASFVTTAIDTVNQWKGAAEALAAYISVRWLATMMLGLGPISAAIAAITAGFLAIQQAEKFFDPSQYSNNSPFWMGVSKEDQLKYPNSPESRKARGEAELDPNSISIMHPSTWFGGQLHGSATDERKATVRDRLAADLGISKDAASGIVAPLNAESNIAGINEKNPTVPGSRGGFGWAQWTGPRRVEFESYAKLHGLDPASDDANYGFLVQELTTKYPQVLAQLRRGDITPRQAADVVTRQYIVPGVPGQSDFEQKVQGHIAGADDVSRIDLSKPTGVEGLRKGLPPAVVDSSVGKWLMGPSQRDSSSGSPVTNKTTTVETNINGPITITTQAKDADGISRDLSSSLRKYNYVPQANTGLQ